MDSHQKLLRAEEPMSADTFLFAKDHAYLARRAQEESRAAERALDPAVRRVHAALANGYAERLSEIPFID